MAGKLKFDNIEGLISQESPTFRNVVKDSMDLVDILIKGEEFLDEDLDQKYQSSNAEQKGFVEPDSIGEVY